MKHSTRGNASSVVAEIDRFAWDWPTMNVGPVKGAIADQALEQMPRPPQTLSRSTPNCRAAVRIGVPTAKLPRLPEGVKITSGSLLILSPINWRVKTLVRHY